MLKSFNVAVVGAALAAMCVGQGAVAGAEVLTLAPHERSITTADGWDITLGLSNALEGAEAVLQVRETHMHIDGCLGPAQVRAFTSGVIDSATTKDGISVYGDTFAI